MRVTVRTADKSHGIVDCVMRQNLSERCDFTGFSCSCFVYHLKVKQFSGFSGSQVNESKAYFAKAHWEWEGCVPGICWFAY